MLIGGENSSFRGPTLAHSNRGVDNMPVIRRAVGFTTDPEPVDVSITMGAKKWRGPVAAAGMFPARHVGL
jgi:hypothetical protein